MKIAVVHDYFTQLGGAEKVAEELYRMLPASSVFATVAFANCMPAHLKGVPVRTSWMQNLPKIDKYYRLYFLLYPLAVTSLDLSRHDLIISSSSSYAKGVRTNVNSVHVCYCHTPMRWVWSYDGYSRGETFGGVERAVLPLLRGLKHWDESASRQPDHFVANSKVVAERIRRAYGRCAEVIHPPIDTERFHPSTDREDYYVVLSRLVSYKRIDLAVQACAQLGRKLLVIGDGPDRGRLERMAGPPIKFLGRASDEDVNYHLACCRALIFPGEEDFGMTPVEAAAAGRPTIAYRGGGAVETVVENLTGIFFDQQTPEHLAEAIERFERRDWCPSAIRRHSENFGIDVFQDHFRSFFRRIGVPVDIPKLRKSRPRAEALLTEQAS
jgi:glycosyltransferase involved in cell wall biosynthesis